MNAASAAAIRKLQPPNPPWHSADWATLRGVLGAIAVEQENGEQSAGASLIGPRQLAVVAIGHGDGHAGLH